MNQVELRRELERLAPFHHEVELPGGLTTPGGRELDRIRVANLVDRVWPSLVERLSAGRVLDVACNCGGFSFEAARIADHVLGIDVVDRYIEQANLLKRALGTENVDFLKLAAEDVDETLGKFDVTLCFGILYHFENPVLAMRKLAAVTDGAIVVDTRLDSRHPHQPYWRMNFREPGEEQTASTSLWRTETVCQFMPTRRAVLDLLDFLSFSEVTELPPQEPVGLYREGDWATFIATR